MTAGLCPDPLGELERFPRPPSTVGAIEGNTLAAVQGRFAARRGVESTLEEAEMNDKVTSKSIIVRDFDFRPKCMCGSRAPPVPGERA